MQPADAAFGLGLHQDAAQYPGPVTIGPHVRVTASEPVSVHVQGAEERRLPLVSHALGQHPGAGRLDRGQAAGAGNREVRDDVELGALVQVQPTGGIDEVGQAERGPACISSEVK